MKEKSERWRKEGLFQISCSIVRQLGSAIEAWKDCRPPLLHIFAERQTEQKKQARMRGENRGGA